MGFSIQVAEIAKKYAKTPAQVLLCFMINRGVSVIPKSNNEQRIGENFECLFDLDIVDCEMIDDLVGRKGERGVRNFDTGEYLGFDNLMRGLRSLDDDDDDDDVLTFLDLPFSYIYVSKLANGVQIRNHGSTIGKR